MQELSTKYEPRAIEDRWYQVWMERGYFHSVPDGRTPYTIVIPPPNVTGILHMGHMLNNTLQDVLTRRARMKGFNACWVPGTDHASIATEAKVVERLRGQGIEKSDLTREQFLEHVWAWVEEHGGIILEQLKRLGASCDWERTAFTMDGSRSESVIRVFCDLYRKGKIYKGVRMVNWDPKARTAVSDEEVVHKEVDGKLYYLRYRVVGSPEALVVATTRPETIMGDVAVCLNEKDPRRAALEGKRVIVPLVNREVPIIFDPYVDMEFGTGTLKITPAHDINDYNIGQKHNLPSIDCFNDDGTVNEAAGLYLGMDRFEVREQIVRDLEAAGLMERTEDYKHNVGFSERTYVAIEPKLSTQWFLRMDQMSKPALEAVLDGDIALIPPKFQGMYRHWMENVHDWCISRQLWWGHRIPAYYLPDGRYVVAETAELALPLARELVGDPALTVADLRQDEDVLDTWFSSWLWPISLFNGILDPDNEEIKYYYPTNDLVTAPEIIFFWVARMIMSGYEYMAAKPFSNVYLTGIVRDKQHRKMSKTLGNSPDPLVLMDKYGADGVRVGMLLCSSAGNDLLFDEALTEQGRNFCNKIWNAFRLVKGWEADGAKPQPPAAARAVELFEARLHEVLAGVEANFAGYRISEALVDLYRLFWDDFSAWLLEMVKPAYGEKIDGRTLAQVQGLFDILLTAMHPFMPFITEELWHHLGSGREEESLMVQQMPEVKVPDATLLAEYARVKDIVTSLRAVRQAKSIAPREPLTLLHRGELGLSGAAVDIVRGIGHVGELSAVEAAPEGASSFLVGRTEFFVPLTGLVDEAEERAKLQKELEYNEGFRDIVLKKLSNERFVGNAPAAVVEAERRKLADAEAKISALRGQLGL